MGTTFDIFVMNTHWLAIAPRRKGEPEQAELISLTPAFIFLLHSVVRIRGLGSRTRVRTSVHKTSENLNKTLAVRNVSMPYSRTVNSGTKSFCINPSQRLQDKQLIVVRIHAGEPKLSFKYLLILVYE